MSNPTEENIPQKEILECKEEIKRLEQKLEDLMEGMTKDQREDFM